MTERLQKILSRAGLGSRREIEVWITQGLVQVNGVTARLGDRADEKDVIICRGKKIQNTSAAAIETRILLYHKPVGEVSSRRDPKFGKTVFDNLPHLRHGRWVQVGRLDLNTSGLLLFTNDGELAHKLMHPKFQIAREYAVRVCGNVTPEMVSKLLKGVALEDGVAKFNHIDYRGGEGTNSWYHVVLTEGRNREVRRLWQSQGVMVSRLVRIRYGSLTMPRYLSQGHTSELSKRDVEKFLSSL